MLNCPDCKADQLFVIDTQQAGSGKCKRRRLECGNCGSRFTSHEIREMDLADNSSINFSQILEKLRGKAKVPKPFRGILKPKPQKVLVGRSWFQRCKSISPCCFRSKKDAVNY